MLLRFAFRTVQSGAIRPLAAVLALATCVVPVSVRAAELVEVPVVVALTGPAAFAGKDIQNALMGVEAVINRTGGIKGRPLKFVYQDDQTSAPVAVQLINGLIAKKATVFLGPTVGGSCEAVRPLVQSSGPVAYCFSPGIAIVPGSFLFSSSASNDDQVAAGIRYCRERGWDRVGVISSTDVSGQVGEVSVDRAMALAENRSMQVVDREHFNPSDVSVAAQMARIKAANVKVLVVYTTGAPLATVLRALSDSGLDVPVLSSSANGSALQLQQYAAFMPAQFLIPGVPTQDVAGVSNRAQHAAIDVYLNAMKALGVEASKNQTVSWDPGMLVATALRAVGPSATADQIRAYLAGLRGFAGVLGIYDFRAFPQRGLNGDAVDIVRWDKAKGDFVGVSKAGGRL